MTEAGQPVAMEANTEHVVERAGASRQLDEQLQPMVSLERSATGATKARSSNTMNAKQRRQLYRWVEEV